MGHRAGERGAVYNIIPLHDPLNNHPSFRNPEVRAAITAIRNVGDLRKPPNVRWRDEYDLLDWLGHFFGFQNDNVSNQREHIILHLASAQMRLSPPPNNVDILDIAVLGHFRRYLLKNYRHWCSYLGRRSSIWINDRRPKEDDQRRGLLYVALYLLIWGESANLRFCPECLCYIFHHMAMELNKILEDYVDESTGRSFVPFTSGTNGYLNRVVKPIYETIRKEVENSKNGTAPHSAWRNYDDINEYFWTKRCFEKLRWPIDEGSTFFVVSGRRKHVGKTGFVEQRSFWNLFRSLDRIWVVLLLFLQVAILIAWEGKDYPWQALISRDVQVKVLTVFITWSFLRLLQSLLNIVMQFSLISRETKWVGVRMVMKSVVASAWVALFGYCYRNIWLRRSQDKGWSNEANKQILIFVMAAGVYLVPEILALIFFIVPWIWNFLEQTNWRIFYMLTWWFQSQTFVGRGIREGLIDNVRYTLFWIFVLGTKFCFSYFLQIKPMVEPTKLLLKMRDVKYERNQLFKDNHIIATGLLWLPVVLIYLMDLQIWYSIYSSIVGATIGLFLHLGEIRTMQQFRLRFQFLPSAVEFNIMPKEQMLDGVHGIRNKFKDFIHRLKLRYGLGESYKKLQSNQVEANKFALIWNEIIMTFREEDIISDEEVELLELPQTTWNIRVIRWPCFLLCNELLLALGQAKELRDAPDKYLWRRIAKHEFRRYAVVEAYDSVKYFLFTIIKQGTKEQSIIRIIFQEIDHSLEIEKFTKTYNVYILEKIHANLISLIKQLIQPKRDVVKVVNALQALYETIIRDFYIQKRSIEQLREDGLAPQADAKKGLLFHNAIDLPSDNDEIFYRQLRRLLVILDSHDSKQDVPRNTEAKRRFAFFTNSLFMSMPHAPEVEKMLAFSVLTPYYNEEVLYSKEQLRTENEDGVSTLFYLQTIYADEWKNFMERMRREGMESDKEIWTTKLKDLRLWASYRGQTLSRTVRGMMYYYRALKLLAFLDTASEMDIQEGIKEPSSRGKMSDLEGVDSQSVHPSRTISKISDPSQLYKGHEYGIAMMKYTYVVACQIYGTQKAKKDPHADEILYLMKINEALRVAYVDEVSVGRDEKEYYSVLVKYDQLLDKEVEIYRVKLPGPLKLGEGKPENQNHAVIFTRGDAIQTIDMNQDNYFEEAIKMRNLLEEFKRYYGIRKPTILGVREHIFTSSVSSIAWFMSAQETSFVTLGQRVLANPLKVRMHYGHPDVFDRFWFLTRGGMSKASRVINISEDIYAGFNCTLRGGNVTHHEYIQVGKGRDVGLNQISMFEAKVSSGNGEQVLSRDVYRLGHRLDFFRMLSFFYTTVGFYFNTMLVVLTVYAFLWGRLYMCLSGVESSIQANDSTTNRALISVLNQQFLIQLGLFTALPMIVENSLEHGFRISVWEFITMQLQLSSIFYTFSMGTKTHYFGRTILHGGAKYRATGRGFVVEHKSFAENYRLYARSHFVKAIELGLILIIYAAYSPLMKSTIFYVLMTLSSWFLVISWIMAPFVFNPSGFDWLKTVHDFEDFMNWIWYQGGVFSRADESWEKWWLEEQDHLRTTNLWGKLLEIILNLRFFYFQYGIVYHLYIVAQNKSIVVYLLSWVYVVIALGIFVLVAYARDKYAAKDHIYYRLVQALIIVIVVLVIIVLREFTGFHLTDFFTSLIVCIPTGWGMISIALVLQPFLKSIKIWRLVTEMARLYDILFAVIVMVPVALLSWTPGFQAMQTNILFNDAFSKGLRIFQILTTKKM